MRKEMILIAAAVFLTLGGTIGARAQAAEARFSNEGYYGFYDLLADDLGATCKAKRNYTGTVSKLAGNSADAVAIYDFRLTPKVGKALTISMVITDSEIPPVKVRRFLTNGRRVRVVARNCDGQLSAVQIVSTEPLEQEP